MQPPITPAASPPPSVAVERPPALVAIGYILLLEGLGEPLPGEKVSE